MRCDHFTDPGYCRSSKIARLRKKTGETAFDAKAIDHCELATLTSDCYSLQLLDD